MTLNSRGISRLFKFEPHDTAATRPKANSVRVLTFINRQDSDAGYWNCSSLGRAPATASCSSFTFALARSHRRTALSFVCARARSASFPNVFTGVVTAFIRLIRRQVRRGRTAYWPQSQRHSLGESWLFAAAVICGAILKGLIRLEVWEQCGKFSKDCRLTPNPLMDTDGRREDTGRGVRK